MFCGHSTPGRRSSVIIHGVVITFALVVEFLLDRIHVACTLKDLTVNNDILIRSHFLQIMLQPNEANAEVPKTAVDGARGCLQK